jgi:periplasmic protein TonB
MASLALDNNRSERKDKALAGFITILIHGALLLFLLWYIIITPVPPYPAPAGGPELELDFGNGVNGTGNVEDNNIGNNTSKDTKLAETVKTPAKANNPVVTNDVENTVPLNNAKKATKTPEKIDTAKPQPQLDIQLAGALNKFKSAKGSSGGNGNSGMAGNAGSPNGVNPGTSMGTGNGLGTGEGKGLSYDLSGRQLEVRPRLVTNNPVQGKIVVGITVDGDGNVTEATPGMIGSTITDASLYALVKNAAMKIKFNKSHDDNPEQLGTVTFSFTIK